MTEYHYGSAGPRFQDQYVVRPVLQAIARRTLTALMTEEHFVVRSAYGAGRFAGLWKSLVVVAQRRPV